MPTRILVAAAIIVQEGKILIARRSEGRHQAGKWEFPGGKVEEGETPEACLVREIQEELGIRIETGALFAESQYRYDAHAVRLLAFGAKKTAGEYRLAVHSEIRWVLPGELGSFDFAPADIPITERLAAEASSIPLS